MIETVTSRSAPLQDDLVLPAPIYRDIPLAGLLADIVVRGVTISIADRALGGTASIIVGSGIRAELPAIPVFCNGFIRLVVQHSNGHGRAADRNRDGAPAGIRILETVIFRFDGKYNIKRSLRYIHEKTNRIIIHRVRLGKIWLPVKE